MTFGAHFGDFGSLFGVPVGPDGGTIWDSIFDVLRRVPRERLGMAPPPPKTLFLRAHGEDYRRGTGHQPR